jgi:hypothetical protein
MAMLPSAGVRLAGHGIKLWPKAVGGRSIEERNRKEKTGMYLTDA